MTIHGHNIIHTDGRESEHISTLELIDRLPIDARLKMILKQHERMITDLVLENHRRWEQERKPDKT